MEKTYETCEEYNSLLSITIPKHKDLNWLNTSGFSIGCLSSTKEKKKSGKFVYGECILVKDLYKPFCPFDFLIVFYEPNIAHLSPAQLEILMYHELLHIDADNKGRARIKPHDIEDFETIINQYGMHWEE